MRPPIKSNNYPIGRSIEDSSCPRYVRKRVVGWRYRKDVRARCERLLTGWSLVRIQPGEPKSSKGLGKRPAAAGRGGHHLGHRARRPAVARGWPAVGRGATRQRPRQGLNRRPTLSGQLMPATASRGISRDAPPPRKALSADLYRGKLWLTRTIVPYPRASVLRSQPANANAANAYEPRLIILACFLDRNCRPSITLCANAALP